MVFHGQLLQLVLFLALFGLQFDQFAVAGDVEPEVVVLLVSVAGVATLVDFYYAVFYFKRFYDHLACGERGQLSFEFADDLLTCGEVWFVCLIGTAVLGFGFGFIPAGVHCLVEEGGILMQFFFLEFGLKQFLVVREGAFQRQVCPVPILFVLLSRFKRPDHGFA
jgi:hypothetical protein